MADKEERYFIHKIFDKGKSIRGDEFITFYNDYGVEFTRQDAIDIMADALIKFKYLNTASADDIEECEKDAEVCLNALLNRGSNEER